MKTPALRYIISSIALCILLFAVVGYFFASSLWFLAAPLPHDGNVFVASRVSSGGVIAAMLEQISIAIPPEYPNPSAFRSVAISKTGDTWQLRGIIKQSQKNKTASELIDKGWNVRMQGPLVTASKGIALPNSTLKNTLSSLIQGILAVIQQSHTYPLTTTHPQVIFSIQRDAYPLIDQDYKGVITTEKQDIVGYVQYGSGDNGVKSTIIIQPQNITENELRVSIQSNLLAHIPKPVKDSALSAIAEDLNVAHQQQEFASILEASEYIILDSHEGEASVMIGGDPDKTQELLRRIIETEESYQYPQKGAFRLPDGTLGFEMRPSKASASWDQLGEGCARYKGKIHEWWVCRNGQQVGIGTNKDSTHAIANHAVEKDKWELNIGKSNLPTEIKKVLSQGIMLKGGNQEIGIRIK